MKKREHLRLYNFSDSKLATLTREKIAFMRRDAVAFLNYGLSESDFEALEITVTDFENSETDVEALNSQTNITADKEITAEKLRVAIRQLMSRVTFKYNQGSASYRKFGTEAFAQKADAELLFIAKRVVRVAEGLFSELQSYGLTDAMLTNIITLRNELEELLITMKMKMSDREIVQEKRTIAGNAIYLNLIRYANTGRAIWETSDVAKYNDYVVYE